MHRPLERNGNIGFSNVDSGESTGRIQHSVVLISPTLTQPYMTQDDLAIYVKDQALEFKNAA